LHYSPDTSGCTGCEQRLRRGYMYSFERLCTVLTENAYGVDDCIDADQFRQPGGWFDVARKVCIDGCGRVFSVTSRLDHGVPRGAQRVCQSTTNEAAGAGN
jgi:hypothetical protein